MAVFSPTSIPPRDRYLLNTMSYKDTLYGVSPKQEQKRLSVPPYSICCVHDMLAKVHTSILNYCVKIQMLAGLIFTLSSTEDRRHT